MSELYVGPCKCGGYGVAYNAETEKELGRCHDDIETVRKRAKHQGIAIKLFNHSVRFSAIIWLAAEDPASPSEALEQLLDELCTDELEAVFGPLPEYVYEALNAGGARDAWEALAEHLMARCRLGLLVLAETPQRRQWIYCESFSEGADKAIAWAKEQEGGEA